MTDEHAFAYIEHLTSDGTAATRFKRALETRSLMLAETSLREMRRVSLLDALEFCWLVSIEAPHRYERTASRWFQRLVDERETLTLDQCQLALACLRGMTSGDRERLRDTLRVLAGGRQSSSGIWR